MWRPVAQVGDQSLMWGDQSTRENSRSCERPVAQGEQSPRWEATRHGGVEMLERDQSHAKMTR